MRIRTLVATFVGLVSLSASGRAHAHFNLLQPPPADSAIDGGKGAPPCGPTTASNVVTPVQGGHPLTLSLTETVMHPGHYRVALSISSRADLPDDPAVDATNGVSNSAAVEATPLFPVLADGLFDHTTGAAPIAWQSQLTLPNVTCAKCTLQIIEFMAEHTANPGGGYFYHHCADLQITADPSLPAFVPPTVSPGTGGASGADGGPTSGGGSSSGCSLGGGRGRAGGLATAALALAALGSVAARRRRRAR